MRDPIARALLWVLRLLLPAHGTHRTTTTTRTTTTPETPVAETSAPRPLSVWRKGWSGPSSADVRAIFHAEDVQGLTVAQRERRYAVAFAELGIDYPYAYPDNPFERARRMGVSA
ncbi:hypothetical protein [Streptomyces huiliensis]|uniref:hypothetical protein n=1 Tax=Streptomyces huiliensis TaxID=2876027 RepID=UPI001CBEBF1F|nr:hypothetical protein [Streptomyces huiliensis]MBZ4319563.1 hypothetical protein [Streptomyces huiliensis]